MARTRANGDATKEKILNAAEALFSEHGFDAVSLRDVTQKAEVTLALSSYHFGTKENLFETVIGRRAATLGALRRERLAALPETAAPRDLLDAFMAPLFEQVKGDAPGWPAYIRLLARLGEDNRWISLISGHFDEVAREFLRALERAVPDARKEDIVRAFTMSLQLMLVSVSRHRRVDSLSNNAVRADDLDAVYRALLEFCSAGIMTCRR